MKRLIALSILLCNLLYMLAPSAIVSADYYSGYFHVNYHDIQSDTILDKAAGFLSSLDILAGVGDGYFSPDEFVSRAQFAKIATLAGGLRKQIKENTGLGIFIDVQPNHWANSYVNTAAKNSLITGYGNGYFDPEAQITLAQATTVILRLLGYTTSDISGVWPYSFVEKAEAVGLLKNINLTTFDALSRADAAIITYNALFTEMKRSTPSEPIKYLLSASELSIVDESIILGSNSMDSGVALDQVRTTTGTYKNLIPDIDNLIGRKYKLILDAENSLVTLLDIDGNNQSIVGIVVDGVAENDVKIKSSDDNAISSANVIRIPDSMTIYYQGNRTTFAGAKQNIKEDSYLLLSRNANDSYDYGVMFDGQWAREKDVQTRTITVQNIYESDITYTDQEGNVGVERFEDNLVVYYKEVKGTFKSNIANITKGTGLTLYSSVPDKYDYAILTDGQTNKKLVSTKVVTIDNVFEYDVTYTDQNGNVSVERFDRNMVVYSDDIKGTFESYKSAMYMGSTLTLYQSTDGKYDYAVLDGGNMVSPLLKTVVVENIVGNDIKYNNSGSMDIIRIEENMPTYYNDLKSTFKAYKPDIDKGSVLELYGRTDTKYDYGILKDPDFVGPNIALKDYEDIDTSVAGIELNGLRNLTVVRNGETATLKDIKAYDVVYLFNAPTEDIFYVYDRKITGIYEQAYPSKTLVNSVMISGQQVDIETASATSKLNESANAYKLYDTITALTGRTGKIVDVVDVNLTDISNYAFVLSTRVDTSSREEAKGQRVYIANLFMTDGTTREFETDKDYSNMRNVLVTYKFVNSQIVMQRVATTNNITGRVNKEDRMIGDIRVSREAKIIDVINYGDYNKDLIARVVNFSDITAIDIFKNDVIYVDRNNVFGDIQLLVLNDFTHNGYNYGIMTERSASSSGTSVSASYVIDIKGSSYNYRTSNSAYNIFTGQPVGLDNTNNTLNSMFALTEVATGSKIQAVDTDRIMMDGKVYRADADLFAYKIEGYNYVPIAINELKNLSKVTIKLYADNILSDGGKVRIITVK